MCEKKYYLEYLKRTDAFPQSVYHRAKHDMVRKMFDSLPCGSKALDAGCGIGNITARYCDRYHITGVDEEAQAIQYCRQFYRGEYVQAPLYKLPFKDESFDMALLLDVIEHLTEPPLALKELARVLKKGSSILICTINYANPLWFILENTWHRFFGGGCKPYSREEHPMRYTGMLLREHCRGLFEESALEKRVMQMELFYVGRKMQP